MLMLLPSSWCTREIWAWTLVVALSLPERQGRTTSCRWEKKAQTGALRRPFSSWEGREHSVGRQAKRYRGGAGTYLRPPLDSRRVHALLPHALQVRQEDLVLRLPKAALGEQPAAANVGREPGLVKEEEAGGLRLHHSQAKKH